MAKRNLIFELRQIEVNIKGCDDMSGWKLKRTLNLTQGHIMVYLLSNPDRNICQKDLEKETKLKKASITGTLDSLEDMGLIERVPSKEDRRKNYIVVTDKAKEIADDVVAHINKVNEIALKGINEEEQEILFSILERVSENLKGGNE